MKKKDLLKIIEWATGNDTGLSSRALCRFMLGLKQDGSIPHDESDRGRCIRLLNLIPEWWDRLGELSELPSIQVHIWSKDGLKAKNEGWKEQIPLMLEEAGRKLI